MGKQSRRSTFFYRAIVATALDFPYLSLSLIPPPPWPAVFHSCFIGCERDEKKPGK